MNLEVSLSRARLAGGAGGGDLAHRPPFAIGPLRVEPALRSLAMPSGDSLVIQPLAMRVLIALAEVEGEPCSRDDLIAACWDARIVGDDAIHRVISTLRRDLALLTHEVVGIETIAKVGYRLRVGASEPCANPASKEPPALSGPLIKRWLLAGSLLVGVVAAGVFAATRGGPDVTTIAVTAENGASHPGTSRFTNGLTDDLATLASTMPAVAFVEPGGRWSSEPLLLRVAIDADETKPTARVRLVDSASSAVVWSREFVSEDGNIDELRERVANGVTGVLQCGLDRSAEFDEPVSLRLFLGACEGLETGDFARARMFAQQITQVRPNSPAGWACLANTTIFAAAQAGSVDRPVLAHAESYAQRALAVDAGSGLAYVALAMAASWRGDPVLAILERGLRADPDFAMLHKHYALALTGAGMVAKAVDPALRAVALHPHDAGLYQIAVTALVNAGRAEEAAELSGQMLRKWRYDRGVAMQRLDLLFHAPDAKAALATALGSPVRGEPRAAIFYEALTWRADPANYDWSRFDRVAERSYRSDPDSAWRLSFTAARMGDRERSVAWLGRAPSDAFMAWSPLYGPEARELRRDPRFFDAMARAGMVARWQKSDRWPDFCREPGLAYHCRARAHEIAKPT